MSGAPLLLVVQHAEAETMGLLKPLCRERKIAWHACRSYAGEAVPLEIKPYQGLVLLGGPMNVDQTDAFPFLKEEIRLLGQALRRQLPALGICLGAQLLAQAAGGSVRHGPSPEIGWFPIRLTSEGRKDPLFSGLPEKFMTFHWHGDTYELPSKAAHLASSERYAQQAFRIGERAYGVQFHGEVTPEMVEQWAGESSSMDPGPLLSGISLYGKEAEEAGKKYLSRFLELVVAQSE